MTNIIVQKNHLTFMDKTYRCAIGKGGFSKHKKEGDGCTPLGEFALRKCWYRHDKVDCVVTHLPLSIIREDYGWSDDPSKPDYNKPVRLPYSGSHEKLWRGDGLYDVFVEIGYNDDPVVAGKGSAIFLHCATEDYQPTEGCVALAKNDLLKLLEHIDTKTRILIHTP
ncbi:MAG: L,D-transpeptidase family protein [Alphaproteobacteria bacterium]|nr:L,D-transpeptidase family protein [Alphaproteobacteria bacterium]